MMKRALPWITVVAAAAWIGSSLRTPSRPEDGMDIQAFGRIPAVQDGRVKPLDSVARGALRVLSDRETFTDREGHSHPAIRWLLDVMSGFADARERAQRHPVFRIRHDQLLHELGLERREGYRYAVEEFGGRIKDVIPLMQEASRRDHAKEKIEAFDRSLIEFERRLRQYQSVMQFDAPHLIPPLKEGEDWRTLPEALQAADPRANEWKEMFQAYAGGDAAKFNGLVASYLERLGAARPKDVGKSGLESFFNQIDPFTTCSWLYFFAFVLGCLSWLGWDRPLNRTAFGLIAFTFAVHTVALATRVYLSGRPPVTNLYGSAVFIGWVCVLLGLVLERIFRLGLGNTIASAAGFLTLLIAYFLSADGDTMAVLQAVLDTQFWLSTHVVCITTGYATTYVSGLLGIVFILRGVLTRSLGADVRLTLSRGLYGMTCFATFFSFVGTVLGGLWADDSWGRFWGWDPKENGALIIVLWNALILHARWGGMVRDRGLAVLAVCGNVVVTWSWFGVNLLGVGLHSYGFTEGRTFWVTMFVLSQLGLVALGLVPERLWLSPPPARGANAQ